MKANLEYLRVFFCAAQCGSLTGAARKLMTSQPNVTRTLNRLEDQLQCRLLVRDHHGVTLTPEGETLLAHVRIAFEHIESAERKLELSRSLQGGVVCVGATEVALRCFLLPILKRFKERYPGVQIRVNNGSTPQAVESLSNGLSDLVVVTTPVELPADCLAVPLMEIQEVAVCGRNYAHLTGREVALAELSRYPIVCLGRQTMTYDLYDAWFHRHGLTLSPSIEAATADQVLPLVRSDLGVGFVPEAFLQGESEHTGILRLRLRERIPARSILFLRQKSRAPGIAATALEQTILCARREDGASAEPACESTAGHRL